MKNNLKTDPNTSKNKFDGALNKLEKSLPKTSEITYVPTIVTYSQEGFFIKSKSTYRISPG